jgi:hypothetical protein
MQGKRRLAASGHAVEGDHGRSACGGPRRNAGDQPGAAGEVRDRTRQAPHRRHHSGGRRRFAGQHPPMQLLQRRPGLQAQLVAQRRPEPAELGQRVAGAARRGQRPDQLAAQSFAQRKPLRQVGQRRDQIAVVTGGQLELGPLLQRRGTFLVQGRGRPAYGLALDARKGVAPPKIEPPAQQRRIAVAATGLRQAGEGQRVEIIRTDNDPVTGRVAHDQAGWQQPAQPGDAGLQLTARGGRRIVGPERFDQRAERHHKARPQ